MQFDCDFRAEGKARARAGNGRHYTPAKTVAFERAVGLCARAAMSGSDATTGQPFTGPVEMEIEAIYRPAGSWSKRRRAAAMGAPHTQKPDADNIVKSVADALNGIAYQDDAQVYASTIRKTWGERDGFRVTVREVPHERL